MSENVAVSEHVAVSENVKIDDPPAVVVAVPISPPGVLQDVRRVGVLGGWWSDREGYSLTVTAMWLAGSLLVLLLASVLTIGPQRRIYFPGLSVPVPETCTMYAQLGIDCPGCGLTRAFIHFADGNWSAGLRLNPAGSVIFLCVVAQIPAAILRLWTGPRSRCSIVWVRLNEIALIFLPCLTLVQWLVRISLTA